VRQFLRGLLDQEDSCWHSSNLRIQKWKRMPTQEPGGELTNLESLKDVWQSKFGLGFK